MTREEAINELNLMEMIVRTPKAAEAVKLASIALCAQQDVTDKDVGKNEPLTLDELREMAIREWVWIDVLAPAKFRSKETESAYYRKYDGYRREEIFWCGYPGIGFGFDYADYETTWIAYRQKPEEG